MVKKKYLFYSIILMMVIVALVLLFFRGKEKKNESLDITDFHNFSTQEFLLVTGSWKIDSFVGVAVQSHINPVVEGYDPTKKEIETYNEKYLDTELTINDKTIISFSPPCELGYYYENTDELFFGYKVPSNIILNGKILYMVLEHKDYKEDLKIMIDKEYNAYIDIDGFFYKLEKL